MSTQITQYKQEPTVRVGIIEHAPEAYFTISAPVQLIPEQGDKVQLTPTGKDKWHVALLGSEVQLQNVSNGELHRYSGKYVRVEPLDSARDKPLDQQKSIITVHDVTIGIQFHWQRKEDQDFRGIIEFGRDTENKITVINELPVEEYLCSVISSEMSGTSPISLLRAHTIIARSWLLAQVKNPPHIGFDICADDHCQRYQGTKRMTPVVVQAVKDTRGQVLTYKNEICDARYSKSCGGISENFENVWQDTPYPYLQAIVDAPEKEFKTWNAKFDGKKTTIQNPKSKIKQIPDLKDEKTVREWILTRPPVYCNADPEVLRSLLNTYDREIPDLFRWKVVYPREELEQLIQKKTGEDIGTLLDLVPVKRGVSGRLIALDIVGSKKTIRVGKELKIRSALSPSHLYSACFVVDVEKGKDGIPTQFTLLGAGWGHGVGLCQIGAAVMATKGIDYKTILFHYYPGTKVTTLW